MNIRLLIVMMEWGHLEDPLPFSIFSFSVLEVGDLQHNGKAESLLLGCRSSVGDSWVSVQVSTRYCSVRTIRFQGMFGFEINTAT